MSKSFKCSLLAFFAVILTVICAFSLPFLSKHFPETLSKVNLSDASVDLYKYSVNDKQAIYLTGEWEFFWNKHIVSGGMTDAMRDAVVQLPSSWTTYEFSGGKLPNGGIASYRATLKNIRASAPLIITVPNFSGSYRVFVNGELIFSSSESSDADSANSTVISYTNPFTAKEYRNTSYVVVIEVDCEYSGGITTLPMLSTFSHYSTREARSLALRFLFIGIGVLVTLGSVMMGLMRKETGKYLWLIILCVTFLFRMLISYESKAIFPGFFPDFNYEVNTMLIFASTYIIKLSMMMHLVNNLNLKIKQITLVIISIVFMLCAFVPYFTYTYVFISSSYVWLQSVTYIVDILMVYKLSEKVISRESLSVVQLTVYCITAASIVIDNYYMNGYISYNATFIMPLGCMIFVALMLVMHFMGISKAYNEAQKTAALTKELAEVNMTLMLSQIQPHFLYNALNTIKYLIKKDPKTAEGAVVKFSGYLRANMDSLTQKEPIPFSKEIDHVKNYVSIESLRFAERLKVEYDIKAENFNIPPLTIQPIVENSIKHGVNQRPEGGTVKISTNEDVDSFYIIVEDNGVGYDTKKPVANDGRSHVGIKNINTRLREMMNASVDVESTVGVGTKVTITIPKNEKE